MQLERKVKMQSQSKLGDLTFEPTESRSAHNVTMLRTTPESDPLYPL